MKVKDCFYVVLKPSTKSERVSSMCPNMGLEVSVMDSPHCLLKMKNVAAKTTTELKLNNCGLFDRVTYLKNFNVEY